MPTIRQVAKAAKVSPMTVSFVLNNKPGQVSDETRERVLRAVREMGYQPRAAVNPSRETTVRTLGISSGVAGNSFARVGYYNAILQGILLATDRLGLNVVLFHNSLFHEDTHRSIRTYFDGRCDGLLVIAPNPGAPLVNAFAERGVPFTLIGDTGDSSQIPFVDVDNVNDGAMVTEYLIKLGHRRIAFVGGPAFVRSACQRQDGYRRALKNQGVPYNPLYDLGDLVRDSQTMERVRALFSLPTEARPTAVFGWNDGAALRAMAVMQELGLRIPEDVSVIGYDDDPDATQQNPPLTTVRQPYTEIGSTAVESLVARIKSEYDTPPTRVFLPTELIIRASTAPFVERALPEKGGGING